MSAPKAAGLLAVSAMVAILASCGSSTSTTALTGTPFPGIAGTPPAPGASASTASTVDVSQLAQEYLALSNVYNPQLDQIQRSMQSAAASNDLSGIKTGCGKAAAC